MPTTATIATATTATAKIELTRVLRIKKPFAVEIISFSTFDYSVIAFSHTLTNSATLISFFIFLASLLCLIIILRRVFNLFFVFPTHYEQNRFVSFFS